MGVGRWERAGVPVSDAGGPPALGYDPDEDSPGPWTRGAGDGARLPVRLPGLVRGDGKPREIAETALAHVVGGVEGAYFPSDLFARWRALMDQWAAFLTETEAKAVRLYG